jgi:hypothetical protein
MAQLKKVYVTGNNQLQAAFSSRRILQTLVLAPNLAHRVHEHILTVDASCVLAMKYG